MTHSNTLKSFLPRNASDLEDTLTLLATQMDVFVSWEWPGEKSAKGEKSGISVPMLRICSHRHVVGPEVPK